MGDSLLRPSSPSLDFILIRSFSYCFNGHSLLRPSSLSRRPGPILKLTKFQWATHFSALLRLTQDGFRDRALAWFQWATHFSALLRTADAEDVPNPPRRSFNGRLTSPPFFALPRTMFTSMSTEVSMGDSLLRPSSRLRFDDQGTFLNQSFNGRLTSPPFFALWAKPSLPVRQTEFQWATHFSALLRTNRQSLKRLRVSFNGRLTSPPFFARGVGLHGRTVRPSFNGRLTSPPFFAFRGGSIQARLT